MKRAQVSIEYMFSIGSILLIFGLIMFIVDFNQERNRYYERNIVARDVCIKASNAISQIYILGDGAEKIIDLTNYNLTITINGTIDVFSYSSADSDVNEDLSSCSFAAALFETKEINTSAKIINKWGVVHVE
jgi:uncharacterized protein (UPF0333 family)